MFNKRKRTLSSEGHRLLNITYNNPTQRFFSKKKPNRGLVVEDKFWSTQRSPECREWILALPDT